MAERKRKSAKPTTPKKKTTKRTRKTTKRDTSSKTKKKKEDSTKEQAGAESKAKHAGGRPRKVPSPEFMQEKFDEYFARQDKENRPYTVPGLAIAVGLTRAGLWKYGKEFPEFVDTLMRAKVKIEEQRAEGLVTAGSQVNGIKFDLNTNFDWTEKKEINVNARVATVEPQDLDDRIKDLLGEETG